MYSGMTQNDPVVLPWGEAVSSFSMTVTRVAFLYYALNYSILLWALWSCIVMWRAGFFTRAMPVMAYLLLQLAAMIHTGFVDNTGLGAVYFGEFPPLALVILMSLWLGLELDRRSVALESSIAELSAETEKRRGYEQQLHYMAYHDYLTDLPNRRQLPEELKKALQQSPESRIYGAMLFLDLDHFKTINDSLGHDFGDNLLQQIALRLRNTLPADITPIRLGGDEFAVILTGLSADYGEAKASAINIAKNITDSITKPFALEHHILGVGVSIGIVLFSDKARDETSVIRQADMALHRAKKIGRNTIQVFTSDMQHAADERLVLEKGLRAALDNGELELHFQPQIHARGEILGAEVLMRWQHPQLGYISPVKFISIAEETGLIHPLGDYALQEACRHIHSWEENLQQSFRGHLSVNVSPWQLSSAGFVDNVKRITQQSGIDCSRLMLEVTESALLQDTGDVADKIRELSETGIRFSIDDFGTGYSALDWIKKIAFNELKIDRTFVHDIQPGLKDTFIETILSIASHLNMQVIAEGVETEAQRTALINMGCNGLQGNLISSPLDEQKFQEWVTGYKPYCL
jgi:diguanylate cyclase (GGDEF)-like protein